MLKNKLNVLLMLFVIFVSCVQAYASDQSTRYWPVGENILDFGTITDGKPAKLARTSSRENTCTCLSTTAGTLLFEGNGQELYYKDEGSSIIGDIDDFNRNSIQGAVLFPVPGEANAYYYVYVGNSNLKNKLRYMKITPLSSSSRHTMAMSVPDSSASSAITVTETAAKDGYWIVSYAEGGDKQFEVFKVTASGFTKINDASPLKGSVAKGMYSNLKLSPDGKSLAFGGQEDGYSGLALFSFDSATGKISASQFIKPSETTDGNMGGCEFSANGKYAYYGAQYLGIVQVDLAAKSCKSLAVDDLPESNPNPPYGAFQLAMDGNIYAMVGINGALVQILNPEMSGAESKIVSALFDGIASPGLPVFVASSLYDSGAYIENIAGTMKVKASRSDSSITEWGVCWSESTEPTISDAKKTIQSELKEDTVDLTDQFTTASRLYVRTYCTAEGSTYYSSALALDKIKPVKIEVKSKEPAKTSVSFNVEVTNAESRTISELGICLGTEASPSLSDNVAKSTAGTATATVKVTGLSAGSEYNYRAYVKFDDDTVQYGTNGQVKTLSDVVPSSAITVVRMDGTTPVPDAIISSMYYQVDGKPVSVTTDASGQFTLPKIPASIKNIEFVILDKNSLPKTFVADKVKGGDKITLTPAELSIDIDILPDSGKLPSVVRVSTDYNDGSHSPEASLTPGEDGHVKASFGYKSQSDSISVIAEGFESQLLVVKDVPEAITLKSRVKDVLKLKVGNTPEVKDSGEVIFTVSAIDSSAIKKSDYTISAYEVGSLKKLSVSVTDNDEKSFNVVCTDSGGSHVLKTGILLNISENSSSAIVLMNTWLSSKQIGDKATNTIHAIGSVDVKSGGAIEAKDSASTGMTGIEVVLPSGGIDTSGLNESCGSSAKAFLEVNVYKLSETASSDVIARTKGSFSSLAEISLDITDCSGPVDPNAGALKELLITIPYDSSQVSVEDIENGVYRVYHSSNLSDFETLDNLILVPVSDIKLIDPVAGTITFTVNHLSVFGVGASSSLTPGASSDNNSGCTIGRTSDSSLVVILMLAVFVAIIRSRSKIKTDQGLK